jgi:hypothetical protein
VASEIGVDEAEVQLVMGTGPVPQRRWYFHPVINAAIAVAAALFLTGHPFIWSVGVASLVFICIDQGWSLFFYVKHLIICTGCRRRFLKTYLRYDKPPKLKAYRINDETYRCTGSTARAYVAAG